MKAHFYSKAFGAMLALGSLAAYAMATAPAATAAQPWYCMCKGEVRRHLASTRHCEHQMGLPKGKWCTAAQMRKVYAPACKKEGCTYKP